MRGANVFTHWCLFNFNHLNNNCANQWSMYPVSMSLDVSLTAPDGVVESLLDAVNPAWHLICPHGCFRCLPSCIVLVHCRLAARLPSSSFKGWVSYFTLLHISIWFAYLFKYILYISILVYLLQRNLCT